MSTTTTSLSTSSSTSQLSPAVQRIQTTFIDPLLQAHKHYEAEQQYKVQATRLTNKQKHDDASQLLYYGAEQLLKAGEANAGSELANLYTQSVARATSREPTSSSNTTSIASYIDAIIQLAHTFDAAHWQLAVDFLKRAASWAGKAGNAAEGVMDVDGQQSDGSASTSSSSSNASVSKLQQAIARLYGTRQQYQQANTHFIRGGITSVDKHAAMLSDWMKQGRPDEADAFIARAVLQYMSVGQNDAARQLLQLMKQRLTPEAYNAFPLLHFLYILLQLTDMQLPTNQKSTIYQQLCQHYAKALEYDAQWKQYLKVIGEQQFGVSSQSALLQMLGSQLFGGASATSSTT